jgi:hypothetical protein
MAKRKPTGKDNRKDLEVKSFRIDDSVIGDPAVYRAVCDEIAHDKLDAIIAGVGGSSDTTVTIYNKTIVAADSEESQVLPANTKYFLIRSRNGGKLRLAYISGGTSANFITIPTGNSFNDGNFYTSIEVFFQSTKPGDVIEIIAYS